MLSKRKYFQQVQEILETKSNLDLSKFELLFDIATSNSTSNEGEKVANEILEGIFAVPVYKELLIPLGFFESELGKAILYVKFGVKNDDIYLTEDVADVTGYSIQYIYKEAVKGNIKGEQRKKVWLFRGKDVDEYLIRKGKKELPKKDIAYGESSEKLINVGYEKEVEY